MPKTPILLFATFLAGALAGALVGAGYTKGIPGPEGGSEAASATPSPSAAMAVREAAAPGALSEPSPSAAAPAPTEPLSTAPPADALTSERLQELSRGWSRLQAEVVRLQTRIDGLERRLAAVAPAASEAAAKEAKDPAEERRSALVKAGLAEDVAADLLWREAQAELERLELRDLALREGWFNSDRYREELSRIQAEVPKLRSEVGDEVYDRYLYASGEQNRVRISSVIPGSAAEEAGLRAGDLIETYEGARIFTFGELRNATSAGERGELVAVQIRRADGSRVQAWLPRGPLGVRLDMARADPDA